MKRFIVISLLSAAALRLLACSGPDIKNYYVFSAYAHDDWNNRIQELCNSNWRSYLGSKDEYFWFDADEVMAAARKKGDQLMVNYVRNLKQYLDCAEAARSDVWDYPTKQDLAKRRQTLTTVAGYARQKLNTRLRSQHGLLLMRCQMMLGQHQQNVAFWEQTASKYINSVYRDMMQNIYAGALLKTGRDAKAGQLFAEQGDRQSLMTQYYKRRSYDAIRQEYLRNPNSAVLPFLLTDFVNNAQEAVDGPDGIQGKLFVRNIQKKEAMQMCQLARQVVSEGKSSSPAMWQSAKAWLEFLFDNRKQASTDILEAVKMEGTERMKDNARVLMLYITAVQAPAGAAFDDYLADELKWIDGKQREDEFYRNALDRLAHQVLADKYAHRPVVAVSLLRAANSDWYDTYVDTMNVERLKQYIDYTSSTAQNALDKYLKARQRVNRDTMNDLVGTKYLRLCKWQDADKWLSRVPLSFYNVQHYAVYAANRRYTVEPWLKRQWLKQDMEYSGKVQHLASNPKTDFARDMLKMEGELNVLTGAARQQRCYDLAVRYAQASFTGDC